ncbi:regulator of telomere elongation helicase 1-like isoform X1 [Lytechinus variegatus]|uniref:regulator of telomere elongation helicase 1-like isoform X1 n=1 Tax=Lytechinus variegatus TaxID=7654 RepID=UPI001BB209C6|nr:regulator of telomere elongation helicase 1-like isoform X1 [Lytechinus variegatus]XP_041483810.1 regulator of telomere elongation helicase 1-like isoform X1 [Lytechinus variegatus]XP_041483811.1 regulator of telomere elongation helicase 1-like isoform X1 [Lytechinus variegatus]
MPSVSCEGVQVDFPFEPYPCQKDYMNKVIQCLQKRINGVLESPTGTGKTLCLLCSTLAWRHTYIAQQELGKCLKGNRGGGDGAAGAYQEQLMTDLKTGAGWGESSEEALFIDRPKIIYASRTHSQLSQALDQLKDTVYRPRVSVLGSREQMCIHPEVLKAESNSAKVHMCRAKVNAKMCHFHNNLDNKKGEKAFTEGILDIEDLVKLGNQHKVCPYYMARELKTSADIIFMPYNYLLDPKSRRIHGIELAGNIVIFDEAHNVERMCEESASFDLTSFDLASCVEETDHLLKKTVEVTMLNERYHGEGVGGDDDFDAAGLATLKKLFLDLEEHISSFNISANSDGITKPGSFIFEFFSQVNINAETKNELMQLLEKMISHLTNSSTVFHNKAAGLQKFYDIITIVFNRDGPEGDRRSQISASQMTRYYKVHIRTTEATQKKTGKLDLWATSGKPKKKGFVLSYWCFSPGFSMQELYSQGVRSIILTSGTLAPLNSFKSELKIDFPVQLENPHVIDKHQMVVGVMTKGPDGTTLNSSYQTRFNKDYVLSLGNAIVNFARMVPNGLLVFFPSYPVMNHALEVWQESGVSNRISQYKQMFIEPRGKADFQEAMESFYERVKDPTLNGAAFFAVCRGKVSEGLDFADNNGRAVVITGLPFPPRKDPRVMLKMQYLDEAKRRNPQGLSGQMWYRQQASRAVNQAIGRVIRHRQDFGAILLCDTRFTNSEARAQLPSWVRPHLAVYDKFGQGVRDLMNFFKIAEKVMPKPQLKSNRPQVTVAASASSSSTSQERPSQVAMSTSSASSSFKNVSYQTAKHVDAHVPSLKKNKDGSNVSEAQLKIMYEEARPSSSNTGFTLLDALHDAEKPKSDDFAIPTSIPLSNQENALNKRPEDPKRKKKIIIKENKFGGQSSSSSYSSISKRQRTACLVSAKDYVTEVKKRLSKESYKAFSNVMQSYKKDNDFGLMIAGLADLFTEDPTKYHLFRKFYSFVRPCHKKRFDQLCKEITGEGCGYRPEDSIEKKKTDDAEDKAQKPQAAKRNMEQNTVGEAAKRHCSGLGSASSIATTSHLSSSSHLSKGADLLNGGADHLNKGTVHLNEGASLWTEGAENLKGS